jgi:hypothetical protein
VAPINKWRQKILTGANSAVQADSSVGDVQNVGSMQWMYTDLARQHNFEMMGVVSSRLEGSGTPTAWKVWLCAGLVQPSCCDDVPSHRGMSATGTSSWDTRLRSWAFLSSP